MPTFLECTVNKNVQKKQLCDTVADSQLIIARFLSMFISSYIHMDNMAFRPAPKALRCFLKSYDVPLAVPMAAVGLNIFSYINK